VFFVDAAHFVYGAFLGYIWCFVKMYLPTPSGRQRLNVLGALDAITHQLLTVVNETYIDSHCVAELIGKIVQENFGIPITLVLDNAKYQRCEFVRQFAEKYNIELLFLPSYSPHLNIIERLWKWIKCDCLYCKYYEKYCGFKDGINKSLIKIQQQEYKKEFDGLFALNFQSYNNAHIMTA
jgi:transposase